MWLWLWDGGIVLDSQQNCGGPPAPGDVSEQKDSSNKTQATGDDSSVLPDSGLLADIFKNIFIELSGGSANANTVRMLLKRWL